MSRESTAWRRAVHLQVLFHGAVVEDRVVQSSGRLDDGERLRSVGIRAYEIGGLDGPLRVPPPPELPRLGILSFDRPPGGLHPKGWHSRKGTYSDARGQVYELTGALTEVEYGDMTLRLRIVPQWLLARVLPGDLAFPVTVAAMMLVVWGLQLLVSGLAAPPAQVNAPEVSADLLARLLDEDFEGEDHGEWASSDEFMPQSEFTIQSVYLPEGDKGPTHDKGGAEQQELADAREEVDREKAQPLPPEPAEQIAQVDPDLPSQEGWEGVQEEQSFGEELDGEVVADAEVAQDAAAKTEGWGLRDHNGALDAREEMEVRKNLAMAEATLRIDPEDAWALEAKAYYQYLQEDLEGAERTWQRFIELYPESPAAYNNLALVYKRRGDYGREEALYRQCLAMTPDDTTAMTNLALNLAHQNRYDEALEIMDQLAVLEPDHPYNALHRAKIHASMGDLDSSLRHLELALETMAQLDTLHSIEFRQDIRIDPAFEPLRDEPRFAAILVRYYGPEDGLNLAGGRNG